MGHIHFVLHYHVVFSTKHRYPYLSREKISMICEIAMQLGTLLGYDVIALNGYTDHLHLLLNIPPRQSVSGIIKRIKGRTSREIGELYWQVGYWVAVVEKQNLSAVKAYIDNQWEYHEHKHPETSSFHEPFA